jgi:hypothetical protein
MALLLGDTHFDALNLHQAKPLGNTRHHLSAPVFVKMDRFSVYALNFRRDCTLIEQL